MNRPRGRSIRSTLPLAIVVSAVLSLSAMLAGCSADSTTQPTTAQKNISQWTMPLDPYQQSDRAAAEYAELLLDKPCMVAAGYSWSVPYEDTSQRNPTTNSIDVRLMTKSIVSSWGYHNAHATLPNEAAWQQFNAMTDAISGTEFTTLRRCQAAARKKIPVVDDESNYAAALVNGSVDKAGATPSVSAASARWHQCMLPAGVSDLPKTPEGMPTPSQITQFDIANPTSVAGPAEIAVATKDLNCRISSGWQKKEYDAEWAAQLKFLTKYRDQLDRNKAILDSAAKKVAQEIADHAPSN